MVHRRIKVERNMDFLELLRRDLDDLAMISGRRQKDRGAADLLPEQCRYVEAIRRDVTGTGVLIALCATLANLNLRDARTPDH